jgi:hypothetical protein
MKFAIIQSEETDLSGDQREQNAVKTSLWLFLRFSCLAVLLLAAASSGVARTAPMPPLTVINHKTHQCAQIVPGDECGDVILPADWVYLDPALGETCPADYTMIDLRPEWVHFKVSFCCSEGHSGSSGDCQDVVVEQKGQQCAFVDDIQKCTGLPQGWKAWGKNCPAGFTWVDDVTCTTGEGNPEATAAGELQSKPPTQTQPAQSIATAAPDVRNPLLPCGSVLVISCGLAVLRIRLR